jgi:hypothetical protein
MPNDDNTLIIFVSLLSDAKGGWLPLSSRALHKTNNYSQPQREQKPRDVASAQMSQLAKLLKFSLI